MRIFIAVCMMFALQVGAENIGLAWDPSDSTDVIGYRIHQGIAAGEYLDVLDVGLVGEAEITDMEAGAMYYLAATAYAADGRESGYSNEVGYLVASASPFPTPTATSIPAPTPTPVDPFIGDATLGFACAEFSRCLTDPDLFFLECNKPIIGSAEYHPSTNKILVHFYGLDDDNNLVYGSVMFETSPKTTLKKYWWGRMPATLSGGRRLPAWIVFNRIEYGADAAGNAVYIKPSKWKRDWPQVQEGD